MADRTIKQGWRDSLFTKIGVYILTGTLVFGTGKIVHNIREEISQQNCANYGWLMDLPEETQRSAIQEDLESGSWSYRKLARRDMKEHNVSLIIRDLERNCNSI